VRHGDADAAPSSKHLTAGNRAAAGAVLMSIADPDRLEIRTEVPETHLYRATTGKAAVVELAAIPGQEITGSIRVELMPSGREGDVNLYRAVVPIAKADPRHRPGMGCKVTVVLDVVDDAVLVPLSAVASRDGARFVRCQQPDSGPVEERKVVVGPDDGKDIVIQQGVRAGDLVVVEEGAK
jgi:multidrug efflux pump subunit AcrA (membrane-fusion protein)